ncbi:MAG: tRNA (adenosine(37)-N6)-threonylcarbamoyltransferase complex dimerization subunit type 1 TsaB [Capnocytophaga sp.]|nr:tRNA (adenosine(37)-N6)-threonylcarbamoyltransferase complex dimerization subunit type 1 TsaB [Capnocytophaga sp.]
MAYLLCLETSGTNCSVAITKNQEVISFKELNTSEFSHSENLHIFIEEVLQKASLKPLDLQAVAISSGPGSYTGLRIGVSSAKGLCFALNIPLIAVPTLSILVENVSQINDYQYIIPMLDARRMEVFSAVFDHQKKQIRDTQAEILTSSSLEEYLSKGKTLFLGNGSDKFSEICTHPNAYFLKNEFPSATKMNVLAFEKFRQNQLENVAYFEPFYLKNVYFG